MSEQENQININNNNKNEELNMKRANLLKQISDQKEKFKPIMSIVKPNFLDEYETYYFQIFKELNKLEEKRNKYFNIDEELNLYGIKLNENLQKILENIMNSYKKFCEDLDNLINKLKEELFNYNLKETEDYINQLIDNKEKKLKEKELKENEIKENEIKEKKLKENELKEKEKKENEIKEDEINKNEIIEQNPQIEIEIEKDIKFLELDGKDNKEVNINLLQNKENFDKILIKNMTKDHFDYIFKNNPENNFNQTLEDDKLKTEQKEEISSEDKNENQIIREEIIDFNSLKIIVFKKSNLEDINIVKLFPNLIKLKIKDSKIDFDFDKKFKLNYLQILKLENIGLIDNTFNELFDKIRTNEKIRNNLKIFSVKNNKISYIDYIRGHADNILSSMTFTNLEVLDMSFNKLYFFQNMMFNCLENIKVIDLTNNIISSPDNIKSIIKSAKIKKCLLLITRNLGVLKEPENIMYNNYLKEILPQIKYPIKKIIFDNIFCNKLSKDIFELDFSFFKPSLNYLDLSNGQLNDNSLIQLFNNKISFNNLKTLILSANFLTEELLYTLSNDNKYILNKLKILKLSENNIKCTDVDKFKKFLEFFKYLEILELKCTPFEKSINQFFRQKIVNEHDKDKKKGYYRDFNEDEKKIEQILENEYLKEKTKIIIYILDLNSGKYTEKINQDFPKLIQSLNVENKSQI